MASVRLKQNYRCVRSLEKFYSGGPYAVSSDGSFIACACDDSIKIVDSSSAAVKFTIEGDSADVTALTLSPDDNLVFFTTHSRQIMVWDLSSSKLQRSWKGQVGPVKAMAYFASAVLLATAGADKEVRVWRVDGGFCTHSFKGHKGVVTTVMFHPDRLVLFSGSDDCSIRIWDLERKRCVAILERHQSAVTSIALSEDGWTLVSAGRDKVVNLWNLHDHSWNLTVPIYEAIEAVCVVPFASYVAQQLLREDSDPAAVYFITVGERGVVRMWTSNRAQCLFEQEISDIDGSLDNSEVKRGFTSAKLLPSVHGLLCVTADKQFFFYNPLIDDTGHTSLDLKGRLVGYNEQIADMKFLGEDERFLAVASSVEHVRVYDLASMSCSYVLSGHTNIVLCLDSCTLRSGRTLIVTGSKDKSVRLWEAETKRCIDRKGCTGEVVAVSFCKKQQNYVVSGSSDGWITVWSLEGSVEEIANLKRKASVAAHGQDINAVAVSSNDNLVCSGSKDRTACIWKLPYLDEKVPLLGHKRGILSVAFSPVDDSVITASVDKTIKIWAKSGSCLKTFEGHAASVLRASFLTHGAQFISCGADGLVKLWTVTTGECIATYDQHDNEIWALAVGRKTEMLATGCNDGVVNLWYDSTAADKEEALRKEEEEVLRGQELENAVLDADFVKAIQIAFELRRPHKLYELFGKLCRRGDATKLMEKALCLLIKDESHLDEVHLLLEYVREWNTKPKLCSIAQYVLLHIFRVFSRMELLKVHGIRELLEGLILYSQRHFSRLERLKRSCFLLDYTLARMSVVEPETNTTNSNEKAFVDNEGIPTDYAEKIMVESETNVADSMERDTGLPHATCNEREKQGVVKGNLIPKRPKPCTGYLRKCDKLIAKRAKANRNLTRY